MCDALEVSRSGYYAYRTRPDSPRTLRHRALTQKIRESFQESGETYGAIRIRQDLLDEGERVGKNTVAYLMKRAALTPRPLRKFKVTTDTRNNPAQPNLLKQNFDVPDLNTSWVTDITAIPTREGWLYLCIFLDLCSRAVIGWSMSSRIKGDLVTDALKMALDNRETTSKVVVHSDQGSQYTSEQYQRTLKRHGMICSMSRKGNCWDNAVAESFFHSLKTERTNHRTYQTRTHAKLDLFEYIEVFYNRRRRHSKLGYQAPLVFEEQFN